MRYLRKDTSAWYDRLAAQILGLKKGEAVHIAIPSGVVTPEDTKRYLACLSNAMRIRMKEIDSRKAVCRQTKEGGIVMLCKHIPPGAQEFEPLEESMRVFPQGPWTPRPGARALDAYENIADWCRKAKVDQERTFILPEMCQKYDKMTRTLLVRRALDHRGIPDVSVGVHKDGVHLRKLAESRATAQLRRFEEKHNARRLARD